MKCKKWKAGKLATINEFIAVQSIRSFLRLHRSTLSHILVFPISHNICVYEKVQNVISKHPSDIESIFLHSSRNISNLVYHTFILLSASQAYKWKLFNWGMGTTRIDMPPSAYQPSRFPSGLALGKSLRPREISQASGNLSVILAKPAWLWDRLSWGTW